MIFCNGMVQLHSELRHIKWRPAYIGIKQDLQDRIKNIRIGRKEGADTDKDGDTTVATPNDENLYILNMKNELDGKVRGLEPF